MYIDGEIRKFIKAPTLRRVKEARAINHKKILEVELTDGTISYYWNNYYNQKRLYDYSHLINVE